MSISEVFLIILVILIIYTLWKYNAVAPSESFPASSSGHRKRIIRRPVSGYKSVAGKAARENYEFYESGAATGTGMSDEVDNCNGTDALYSQADYADIAKILAIEPAVVKNHAEFVQDRLNTGNTMGKTWSPDSHESYDPTPWAGIRGRPVQVAIGDPSQIPDVNINLYPKTQKLRW